MIYTFGTACFFAYVAIFNIDYINLIKPKSLLPILEDVTNAFYTFYMIIATLLILMRAKKVAETLNQFTTVFKDGVFCSSAKRIAVLTQYGILATLLGTILLQGAIVYWLHLTRNFVFIQGLTSFLLEYSTRISNQDEHQQVRYFIEKLKQHRPFTASGVFTIDLGIAGPISANILTYVLVALQFDLPEE
ncbi:hypothetical protein JTB14_011290 [Gonioctena quinquepunctata]|nr:hypothetical protein JTB14_011290 [Gonioctena quinquepunctata]